MNKIPEILVTPNSVTAVERLIKAGANAVVIGEEKFGLRLAGEFSRAEVEEATKIAHEHGAKVYVAMNAIFHNDRIAELPDYLAFLDKINVDAVIFGDPAVIMAAKEVAPNMRLHWNTETTATNWFTANYWGKRGATRVVVAREINMDAIVEMKEHAEVEVEVQVHGMTNMFQSKRTLIGNYFQYQGKDLKVEKTDKSRQMFLYDPERGAKYPIYEDINGTHIMSPKDICIIDELEDMLEAGIDSFKIEGLFKSTEYMESIIALYKEAIQLYFEDEQRYEDKKEEYLEQIRDLQPPNRDIDTGFFFKETVY
ncbi:peptidase U32 family protein [Bacillus alkalicellulosilyticus]|uniref:peptidase U32 family protein n=1 Tax=Alkalihalobacterium alkalicellulosilyticum TaxID=1912214 RepID=UPI0009978E70|nr:peptidase U32 family protein [Bacillus alkalicellulosilyticus]